MLNCLETSSLDEILFSLLNEKLIQPQHFYWVKLCPSCAAK